MPKTGCPDARSLSIALLAYLEGFREAPNTSVDLTELTDQKCKGEYQKSKKYSQHPKKNLQMLAMIVFSMLIV